MPPRGRRCPSRGSTSSPPCEAPGDARPMRRTARLIDLLVARWPGRDRRELFSHVLRGDVTVNGTPVLKPGAPVPADAELAVRPLPQYVSRGGGKLAAALDRWHVNCAAGPWIDAGSSTGGFTDCLLQRGAPLVF